MKIPVKMSEYSKEVKSRYITPFSVAVALMSFFVCYIYLFKYKSILLGLICFILALTAAIIPFVKHKTHHYLLVANFIVLICFIGVSLLAAFSGGVLSTAIYWLSIIPLFATFLMNAFFGIVWFIAVMIDFFLIYYLGTHDLLPANVILSAAPLEKMLISFTLNTTLVAILCILSDLIRDKAFVEKEELRLKTFQLTQLASLGKMASSVAHEVNNPLTVIKAAQMRVQRLVDADGPVDKTTLMENMDKIQRNVLRIQEVTALLGTISEKSRDRTISSINIKSMFEDIIHMRQDDLDRYNITLITHFPEEPILFSGIFTDLFQAILNVFENAIYELKNSPNSQKILKVDLVSTGNDIRLNIEDNGEGVPAELRARIFDPFYKSKSFDDKKGLGLSFSYNVINNNGGSLELLNSTKGTLFQINLPRA